MKWLSFGKKGDDEQGNEPKRTPAHDRESAPQAFVPSSLSVHADLLPTEFAAERKDAKVLRMAGIVVVGLLLIGLLASVGTALVAKSAESSLAAEQARSAQLATEKAQYSEATGVLADISDARSAQTVALFAETRWQRITDELNASLPGGMSISKLTLTEPLAPGQTAGTTNTSETADPLATPYVISVEYELKSSNFVASADLLDALPAHLTGLQRATTPTVSFNDGIYTFTGTVSLDITAVGTDRANAIDADTLQQLRDAMATAAASTDTTTGGN